MFLQPNAGLVQQNTKHKLLTTRTLWLTYGCARVNNTAVLRYDTINYTYVRSKADEETAYSAAQNQQTKRVTKKQKQDAQKQRFSYKVRTVSPDDKHEV